MSGSDSEDAILEQLFAILYDLRWHTRGAEDEKVLGWLQAGLALFPYCTPARILELSQRADATTACVVPLLRRQHPEMADAASAVISYLSGEGSHYFKSFSFGPDAQGQTTKITIMEMGYAGAGDTIGARLWSAAPDMCDLIFSRRHFDVAGKNILELGCGVGLPGILCAKLGAAKVTLSDYQEQTLANALKNIQASGCDTNAGCEWMDLGIDRTFFQLVSSTLFAYLSWHRGCSARLHAP
eukprot:m.66665 g.66665  ORF g.66665 m.66665 type:complete len:241 (-) comp49899_c0_seq7:296-1018(-)